MLIGGATLSAIAGTTLGLGVTGILAAVVTSAARFTPAQGSDQVVYLAQLTNGSIDLSGLLLAAVIFGGLGSISGSILGTILLVALPELFRSFAQWRLVFYGLAVILIMVGRPQGLIGGLELTPSGIRKTIAARRARIAFAAASKSAEREGIE